MSKFLNKYVRKLHRWLALPFVIVLIITVVVRNTPAGFAAQRAQQIILLTMALTGLYLYVLPWWVKWRKRHRRMS